LSCNFSIKYCWIEIEACSSKVDAIRQKKEIKELSQIDEYIALSMLYKRLKKNLNKWNLL